MVAKIASTVFKSGPDDQVAAVDVYRAKTAETINAAKAAVSETVGNGVTAVKETLSTGIMESIENVKFNIAETLYIDNFVNTAKEAIIEGRLDTDKLKEGLLKGITSKEDAIARLKDIMGGSIANIEALKTDLATNLLGSMGITDNPEALARGLLGLPGGTDPINVLLDTNPSLKILYDTNELIRNGKDIKDAKGLVALANSVLGNSELAKILDAEAQFKTLGNLVGLASKYKIPQLYDEITQKMAAVDERRRFLLQQLDTALRNGDLELLRRIIDDNGADKVLAKNPNCVSLLLAGYILPFETKVPRQVDYDALLEVLNLLTGDWYRYNRRGILVIDLGVFTACSTDARNVLSMNAEYKEYFMFCDTYPSEDLVALSKRNHPKTGLPLAA